MAIIVRIPGPLRQLTEGKAELEIEAKDVAECLDKLGSRFPGLKERLWDDKGQIHRYNNVYVKGDEIRFLQKLATALKTKDEVRSVPAVAGG